MALKQQIKFVLFTFVHQIEHDWGNLDGDAKRKEDAETNRLAVCNLDWDRVTANDIFGKFSIFGGFTRTGY